MSIAINSTTPAQTNTDTGVALKTAGLAKSQQELEGQMALNLIQSAVVTNIPSPVGNTGSQINIKV